MTKSTTENMIWYFAYGSNLYKPQMRTRIGTWKTSKQATLKGWKLTFNRPSRRWKGKTANIYTTNKDDDIVYGAIYQITQQQLSTLSQYEGENPGNIEVTSLGETIQAKTYTFHWGDEDKPPRPYLDRLLLGLKQHGYDEDVINYVKKIAENPRRH